MLQCECGFTCGTVNGYAAHLARFSGAELSRHQLVPANDAPEPSPSAPKSPIKSPAKPEAKRPQTRSWMKMLTQAVDPSRSLGSSSLRKLALGGSGSPKKKGGDGGEASGTRAAARDQAGAAEPLTTNSTSSSHTSAGQASEPTAASPLRPSEEGELEDAVLVETPVKDSRGPGKDPEPRQSMSGGSSEQTGWDVPVPPPLSAGGEEEDVEREEGMEGDMEGTGDESGGREEEEEEEDEDELPVSEVLPPLVQEAEEPEVIGARPDSRSYAVRQLANTASFASIMGLAGLKGFCTVASRVSGIDFASPTLPTPAPVSISAAADTLLWKDQWLSLRVFGMGLYLLICVQQLVAGGIAMHPSTVLASSGLFCLAWNLVRNQFDGGRTSRTEEREVQLQQAVTDALFKVAISVIPLMGAVAGLAMSGLSGRKLGPTMWCGAATVLILMVGELQFISQMTLLMLVWIGAFTLPWLYTQCQHALDTLVEEAVDLAAMLLSLHSRPVLAAAGAAGVLAGGSMAASGPTVCLASAAAAGGGVLWYNHLRVVGSLTAPQLSEEQQQQQGSVARKALPAAVMDDLD